MDDLGPFGCQNSDGPDAGKRGHGNRTVTARYGPDASRRMLRCSTGTARFSERKGPPVRRSAPPEDRDRLGVAARAEVGLPPHSLRLGFAHQIVTDPKNKDLCQV